ncbi:protein phosphatase [Kineococcus xinjiangensis]|uniref:Serine/threonine protein phosphatase PstP n=1 Tax=Kineococcus xinjiangensis TaxID=512762 RepID=A0A2S6IJ71_9ACTN|nr:Stp1/IreP family PP2C-type Ser/Thr phosphatase [Kineococcus xinjiangensis]PPK94272.1 protein phosphatase [Kineococcus xinjiangensis]
MAIALRYAARSDVGLVRSNNQDSGYAGPHLLVVADGMGGHAGGDVASSLAVGELSALDGESHGSDDAAQHLVDAVQAANAQLRRRVGQEPELSGMGTTVTALLRTGARLVLAHIGDSRAYLLREGELTQLTRDHTYVQSLIDSGQLTPEEAEGHPQRSVIMRVLTGEREDRPDVSVREARRGDRFLLCSDGLSSVVSADTLHDALTSHADPAAACERLVELALRGGAPDNVTCVVADVVTVDGDAEPPSITPQVVGAAAFSRPRRSSASGTPAAKAAKLRDAAAGTGSDEEDTGSDDAEGSPRRGRRRWRWAAGLVVLLLLVGAGGYGAWRWTQGQYFVGESREQVAVFRGLAQDLGPVSTARVVRRTDISTADLPEYRRDQVQRHMTARDLEHAVEIVDGLRRDACRSREARERILGASPAPTTSTTDCSGTS